MVYLKPRHREAQRLLFTKSHLHILDGLHPSESKCLLIITHLSPRIKMLRLSMESDQVVDWLGTPPPGKMWSSVKPGTLCLLEGKGLGDMRERKLHHQSLYFCPPSSFSWASCYHDREHGHCGGPEAHPGRRSGLFVEVTTGEIRLY